MKPPVGVRYVRRVYHTRRKLLVTHCRLRRGLGNCALAFRPFELGSKLLQIGLESPYKVVFCCGLLGFLVKGVGSLADTPSHALVHVHKELSNIVDCFGRELRLDLDHSSCSVRVPVHNCELQFSPTSRQGCVRSNSSLQAGQQALNSPDRPLMEAPVPTAGLEQNFQCSWKGSAAAEPK